MKLRGEQDDDGMQSEVCIGSTELQTYNVSVYEVYLSFEMHKVVVGQ